ncbi:MAG: hypothetical protein JW384_03654 [Nitrosomonadaceae bacterium]|nr:hypothetical protein [Nitrosomonadaceae bacterium]
MNTEEEEFKRIEREALRRAQAAEDDDTQVYVKPWVGLTEDEAFVCRGRDYFETYKAIEAKLKEKNT